MATTLSPNGYCYPWRDGNQFELLVDGPRYFERMLKAINQAREELLLELYLVEDGQVTQRFVTAFCAARGRGVRVRLLLDDFGARGLSDHQRTLLKLSGTELLFYNPLRYGELRRNLLRDHRKLLLVDGVLAFVGGTGLNDEFLLAEHGPWHDLMLAIEGPCVADWRDLFLRTWQRADPTGEAQKVTFAPPAALPGGESGRVTHHGSGGHKEIKRSLIKRVRGAERQVWITTAYFIPSWKVRRLLRAAARRGVDVRLLLPGSRTDHPAVRHAGRRFYAGLLRHGVRIFEYQPRFVHAKYILVDQWCSLGSSNIDRWNMHWNLEANQEVEGSAFAAELAALFRHDLEEALEIDAARWLRRPWRERWLEWFWGLVDLWLLRLRRQR